MSCLGKMSSGTVGKVVKSAVKNGGDELVGKILHSRATLQASDLSGQTFNSVLRDLRKAGLENVKIVPTKSGGHVVHVADIERTGVCGLFPGGVMTPNGGHLTNVSFKFNNAGDCIQLTGVQKTANAVAGSTIRTAQGVEELAKAGVHNPTEYIQAYSSGKHRYVNKTFSPFGDKPIPVNTAKEAGVASQSAAKAVNSAEDLLTGRYNETLERIRKINPQEAQRLEAPLKGLHDTERGLAIKMKHKQRIVDTYASMSDTELTAKLAQDHETYVLRKAKEEAERRLYTSTDYIQNSLQNINPELGEKVSAKIFQIAEKDPAKAQRLADRLIERYSGTDLERFRSKTPAFGFDDNSFRLPDIDDYYPRSDNLFKNPLDNPWG